MSLSRHVVDQVAELAALDLSPEERARLQQQLGVILEHVERLKRLDTDRVAPMPHAVAMANVLRADEPGASLSREAVGRLGPEMSGGFFRVPKILDEGGA